MVNSGICLSILNQINSNKFLSYQPLEQNRAFSSSQKVLLRVGSKPSNEDDYNLREKAERIKKMKAEERKNNPPPPPEDAEENNEEEKKEEPKVEEKTKEKETKDEKDEKKQEQQQQKKKTTGADYEDMGDQQATEKVRTKPNWHAYGVKYSLPLFVMMGLYAMYGLYSEIGFSFDNLKEKIDALIAPLTKPTNSKLLPDIADGQPQKPVLILAVEDLLIHTYYTPRTGWKTQKRPGLDNFLKAASQYYELVLFSENYMATVQQIIERIDPNAYAHKLFKDSTTLEDGKVIKDLSLMNRPIEKIVLIDHRTDAYSKQPENALVVEPWKGDTSDKLLTELIPFLELVASKSGKIDVRTILNEYGNREKSAQQIAREFIARLQSNKQRAQQQAQQPTEEKKQSSGGWFGFRK